MFCDSNSWAISLYPYLDPWAFHSVFFSLPSWGGKWQRSFGGHLESIQDQSTTWKCSLLHQCLHGLLWCHLATAWDTLWIQIYPQWIWRSSFAQSGLGSPGCSMTTRYVSYQSPPVSFYFAVEKKWRGKAPLRTQSNPAQRMKAVDIHATMSSYSNAVKCGDLTSGSRSHQATVISVLGKYFEWPSAYFPYLWHPDEYMYDTSGLPASSYIHNMHSCTLLLLQQQIWHSSFPGAKRTKELTQLWGWWHAKGWAQCVGEGICHWQCSNPDPDPQKLCCQVQGSFSPCLSNGEYDICLGTHPRLLVTVTHPEQTFQAVQPDKSPHG